MEPINMKTNMATPFSYSHLSTHFYKPSFMTKVISATSLLLISLSPMTSFANPPKGGGKAVDVGVETVGIHDVNQSLTLVSKLEAAQSVVIQPEVSGKIESINIESNQQVEAGQVLFELDKNRSAATFAEAKAYLNDERRKEQEYARLVQRSAVTKTELDAQRASVIIAQARLDAATADLSYMTIKAPFSGTVGLIDFSVGKTVSQGEELITLDNLDTMRLDLQIPERYLSQVSVGMKVKTTSRAWQDKEFIGTITHISSRVNNANLSVPVRISIPNPDKLLKPGMLMTATLLLPTIHKPIIPVQSVEYSGTKRYVYVAQEGKAVRTEVMLGERVEDKVVIQSGLELGQDIITKGLVNMRDGVEINPVERTNIMGDASDNVSADEANNEVADDAEQTHENSATEVENTAEIDITSAQEAS